MGTVAVVSATAPTGRRPQRIGQRLQWEGNITMSTSYATGGDTIKANSVAMQRIVGGVVSAAGANSYQVIPQTNGDVKIKAIVNATGAEVANATNLSAITDLYVILHGR